jgi:hypothetical protein
VALIIVGVTLAVLASTGVLTETKSSTTIPSGMHNKSYYLFLKHNIRVFKIIPFRNNFNDNINAN